jgi:Rrf2 family iron-sulfur cluster assembly transcriptional regulator
MIDLALRETGEPVPLVELALRHRISLSYLEQVFAKLRQHGLVESTRGPGGGYALGFRGDKITVADIIGAIEDGDEDGKSASARETSQSAQDMTQGLWDDLHCALVAHMKTITLHGLALEQRAKGFQVAKRKVSKKGVFQKPATETLRPNVPNSVFTLGQSLFVSTAKA